MAPDCPSVLPFPRARSFTRPTVRLLLRARRALTIAVGLALVCDDARTLFADVLERRLAAALLYYSVHRPHAGLGGATPLERDLGLTPAHASARPPARDRPGQAYPLRLTLTYLDDERRFPVLVRRAA